MDETKTTCGSGAGYLTEVLETTGAAKSLTWEMNWIDVSGRSSQVDGAHHETQTCQGNVLNYQPILSAVTTC